VCGLAPYLLGMVHVDMRKLPAAAQEERRRQVIGLRESGLTHAAIAAQVGLSENGVSGICRRYAERGLAGLVSGPRGPAPGTGRFLSAQQETQVQALICRHLPDELGLPYAFVEPCGGADLGGGALRRAPSCAEHGHLPGTLGLHGAEAAAAGV
jgi:hypothetical protein